MNLPTRVSLRVGPDGPTCSFTALLNYFIAPHKGDRVLLQVPKYGQVGVIVTEVFHFVPLPDDESACLLITMPIISEHYDDMLSVLDWFKAMYGVDDIQADNEPELYYKFYRNLIHVLGLTKTPQPVVDYDPVAIKVFAEACRAIVLAELKPSPAELPVALTGFNPTIQHLHELVLSRRQEEPDGANMLAIIKTWEQLLNQKKLMLWTATIEDCLKFAQVVFARLPSIPPDRLPPTLRTE